MCDPVTAGTLLVGGAYAKREQRKQEQAIRRANAEAQRQADEALAKAEQAREDQETRDQLEEQRQAEIESRTLKLRTDSVEDRRRNGASSLRIRERSSGASGAAQTASPPTLGLS